MVKITELLPCVLLTVVYFVLLGLYKYHFSLIFIRRHIYLNGNHRRHFFPDVFWNSRNFFKDCILCKYIKETQVEISAFIKVLEMLFS